MKEERPDVVALIDMLDLAWLVIYGLAGVDGENFDLSLKEFMTKTDLAAWRQYATRRGM